MQRLERYATPATALWLALVTVLVASWAHVAGTFGTLEHGGAPAWLRTLAPFTAPMAAVAVDVGLIALAWGVGARARAGKPARDLWAGVAVFAALSALANFDHALSVVAGPGDTNGVATFVALPRYAQLKLIALSATLPLLALYLARVLETSAATDRETVAPAAPEVARVATPMPELVAAVPAVAERHATVATPVVHQVATDPRERVRGVAALHPSVSQRELARRAETSPTTVARMIEAGELHRNGNGWEVA